MPELALSESFLREAIDCMVDILARTHTLAVHLDKVTSDST